MQSTHDYITQAKASLDASGINTGEFEAALNRLEQIVGNLPEGAWLVDDTMFLNIYGSDSWHTQRNTALIALLILCAGLSSLFAPEQNADLRRMLHSTPRGRKRLFWAKHGIAVGIAVLVWLMEFVQEWHTASEMLGEAILNAPCGSISMLQSFPGTVRSYLAILCISKGISLLLPLNLCVFMGESDRGFEKAFLINLVFMLIPAPHIGLVFMV